jgi:hypothetical protein
LLDVQIIPLNIKNTKSVKGVALGPGQELKIYTLKEDGSISEAECGPVTFVPLVGPSESQEARENAKPVRESFFMRAINTYKEFFFQ